MSANTIATQYAIRLIAQAVHNTHTYPVPNYKRLAVQSAIVVTLSQSPAN